MKKSIALSLCLAFVASVAFAFPPGMPPKENPLVTRVAPEEQDLGVFFSWQGTAPADSSSTNKVEQVLAKPKVKDELAKRQASFVKLFSGAENNAVAEKIAELALKNGACVYGESKESVCGMISLDADSVSLVEKIIADMKKAAAAGEIKVANIKVGSIPFYKVTDSSEEDFYWGILGKGRVLVFSSNLKGLTAVLTNARTPDPNWVTSAKNDFAIERLSTLSAFSKKFIKEMTPANAAEETDPATDEFQKKFLGGDYVDKVVGASGLDSVGSVHKTAVYMKDGWKNTLPGVMINKPLAEKDLSAIPSNAVVAIAGKTDLNDLLKAVSKAEGLSDEMKMQIAVVSMAASPYLSSLGDSWSFFVTEEDGVSGGALVWSLKNPAMAKIQLKQLMEMLKKNMKTEMQIEEFGLNNLELRVIPTQLKLFGDDEDEDQDDNGPMPGIQIQVMPGGQIPPGAIPGGAIPQGAVPLGGGQLQLGGGNIDPSMLLGLLPQSIEKIKIGGSDFWLLKNGDDESNNIVIGVVGKNLVVTTKSYAEKYVKFDGSKNISSNKAVAKMMANNPSYLIYSDPKYIVGLLQTFGNQLDGNQLDEGVTDIALSTDLPIVVGVYSTDNAVRIDSNSGLPLPDMLLSSVGLFAFGSEESN